MAGGAALRHHARPGMLALDVARIEAGLILLDVDYMSAKKALIPSQKYTPYEIGLGRLVHLDKAPFIGQAALRAGGEGGPGAAARGPGGGLGRPGAPLRRGGPGAAAAGHRLARLRAPSTAAGTQVGKATSSTWSPTLKKMIALATRRLRRVRRPGTRLEMEITVDHQRKRGRAPRWRSCRSSTRPASAPDERPVPVAQRAAGGAARGGPLATGRARSHEASTDRGRPPVAVCDLRPRPLPISAVKNRRPRVRGRRGLPRPCCGGLP